MKGFEEDIGCPPKPIRNNQCHILRRMVKFCQRGRDLHLYQPRSERRVLHKRKKIEKTENIALNSFVQIAVFIDNANNSHRDCN